MLAIFSAVYILLMFATAVLGLLGSMYGNGTGPVILDNVHCAGNETSLEQCTARNMGNHNLGYHEDAGVRCMSYDISHVQSLFFTVTQLQNNVFVLRYGSELEIVV